MPFRSKDTLQAWLDEFAASKSASGTPYVADHEASDGRDSGLVMYPLQYATTSVLIQPVATGDPEWTVTIEAQPEITELPAKSLYALCRELTNAADLCAFLREKSRARVAKLGAAGK